MRGTSPLPWLLLALVFFLPAGARAAATCSPEAFEAFVAGNLPGRTLSLDCSLTLPKDFRVLGNIVFEGSKASGAVLDCNGATIDVAAGRGRKGKTAIVVRSLQRKDGSWDAPEGVTVRDCRVEGFMRVYGLDENANGANMKASSRRPDHTRLAQAAAPKRTTFDKLTVVAPDGIALYVGPGVLWTKLQNSRIDGTSGATAIYLDAESGRSLIRNNDFRIRTEKRELIAIDGSTRNRIVNNTFHDPANGGIFVYRNCGEGGVIRHQTPNFNRITDNRFLYREKPRRPAVWLNSRNGRQRYCFLDPRYRFGSSKSPLDFARNNVVSLNRIRGGDLGLIRDDEAANEIFGNRAD